MMQSTLEVIQENGYDQSEEAVAEENWDSWDPMNDDYNSEQNTLALNPDREPLSRITGRSDLIVSKLDNIKICERFVRLGECADGDFCERLHVAPTLRDKIERLQETSESNRNRICLNFTYLSPSEFEPDADRLLLVSITDAKSPVNFYMVAPFDKMDFAQKTAEDLQFYTDRVQQHSTFRRRLEYLHDQLALFFDHSYRVDNLKDDIYLSQIVACKLKDGHYRRAMVIGTPDLSEDLYEYKLLLLDLGVEIYLPRELIYDIKASCLSDPPMALNARLDVKPAAGNNHWSEEALDFFVTRARGVKYLLCKILDYSECDRMYTVRLFHCTRRADLMEMMISRGLAESCDGK